MATTKRNRVGRTRERLAALLNAALAEPLAALGNEFEPEQFYPEDIQSQIPAYATPQWDCCSWFADSAGDGPLHLHVSSWSTMAECVRAGIVATPDRDTWWDYEVSPRGNTAAEA